MFLTILQGYYKIIYDGLIHTFLHKVEKNGGIALII